MSFAARATARTRALAKSGKRIGTHSGGFQADEALGCWLLRQLPEYAGAQIVRSRDKAVLDTCDIVIDVGDVYDPQVLRFDHHQRGFFETVDGQPGVAKNAAEATGRWKTKLSASGLIYKHYGHGIIAQLAETSPKDTEFLWAELYERFMEGIDGIDNGIELSDGPLKYKESSDLSTRVGRMNPRWNEGSNDEDRDARFANASELCGQEFLDVLDELVEAWLPARVIVKKAVEERMSIHPSGKIIYFETGGSMPWLEHLYSIERELKLPEHIKFVLFTDSSGMRRVQAVTVEGTKYQNRVSLLEAWRGLRGDELSKAAGIQDCCFVHNTGFIGGNNTYEGALAMAVASIPDN